VDVAAWQQAGVYDPRAPDAAQRLELLTFLTEQGASLDEIVHAHASGRLFALAGDRIVRPQRDTVTLREVADLVGLGLDQVLRMWRAFGFPDVAPDDRVAAPDDVDLATIHRDATRLIGEDAALGLARVMGAAAARVADAASAATRGTLPEIAVSATGDELLTAKAWAAAARFVPAMGRAIDIAHRHHLEAVRAHFELLVAQSDDPTALQVGVGFADLSGFTELSRQVPLGQLSAIVSAFESTAASTVLDHGGRVVKFIGDAVMFIGSTAERTAAVGLALVQHPRAAEAGIPVRAGIALGPVLAQEGDYFGPPVNLAARLVAIAAPGTLVADRVMADALDPARWTATPKGPQSIRGFADRVEVFDLHTAAASVATQDGSAGEG
jgi:class 3 adenylate cyclase